MPPADPQSAEVDGWTVERVLGWAAQDFQRRGLDSPRLDAELLLGHVLDLDRVRLIMERERPLAAPELARFRELIKRRRAGEPIAYIRGTREFYGLPFQVDPRVLIPRPDTEPLVEVAWSRTRARDLFGRALDLCTGSGCVAIAFQLQRATWATTGIDVDAAAIAVARDNAVRLGAVPGTRFLVGDLFAPVADDGPFDLVMANPPYVPATEYDALPIGIRDFEPRLALHGGDDGLDVIRRIVEAAPSRIAPHGVLALEIGWDQGERVRALLQDSGFADVELTRDYGGRDRVVSGRRPG